MYFMNRLWISLIMRLRCSFGLVIKTFLIKISFLRMIFCSIINNFYVKWWIRRIKINRVINGNSCNSSRLFKLWIPWNWIWSHIRTLTICLCIFGFKNSCIKICCLKRRKRYLEAIFRGYLQISSQKSVTIVWLRFKCPRKMK